MKKTPKELSSEYYQFVNSFNQPAYDTATRQFTVQWTWCWHEEVRFDAP